MPNPVPAAATGLPAFPGDAELVRLGRELEEAAHVERPEPQQHIRGKIEDIEARGLAGLFVKARAVELALNDDEAEPNAPGSLLRLTNSLIVDFRAIQARMTDCPVEKITCVANEVIAAWRRLDEERPDDSKDTEEQLMERLSDLEQAATSARARSAVGAMFQICVAWDLIGEIEETGFSQRINRRLRRSLYSIVSVLEAMAGERAEVCRGFYLSPELDPFACTGLEIAEPI
jgi:hypothetical protein